MKPGYVRHPAQHPWPAEGLIRRARSFLLGSGFLLEYSPLRPTLTDEMIQEAQNLGSKYETLVDALRAAKHGMVEIVMDEGARQVTVFEGGDVTGSDWSLVNQQRGANLFHSHVSLTEDSDKLTAAWTAGAYRPAVKWLGDQARESRGDTVMFALPNGDHVPLFSRPTIIRVPEQPDQLSSLNPSSVL